MRDGWRRGLALACVLWAVGLAGASGASGAVGPGDTPAALTLTLGLHRLGYVSATVTGPAQASVALAEADRAGHRTVTRLVLPATGTVTVPMALTDLCAVRARTLTATASAAATPRQSTRASVTTPACTTRLAVAAPARATAPGTAAVTLTDRWGVGNLPVRVCAQPPGGLTRCRAVTVPAGQRRATFALALPRIGGLEVTAAVSGGRAHRAVVWAQHRGAIRLLAAGDSEMQILDDDISAELVPYGVAVTSFAQPSTGLTNPQLLNWQAKARRLAARVRPDISVVFMGANDGYPLNPGAGQINCCGTAWSVGYGQLVAQMARTLLRGQAATAYWFVLPAPKPAPFQRTFAAVNAGIADAARALAGRLGRLDANAYFTPGNRYRNTMTVDGQRFVVHEPDGIHLSAAADHYAAGLVLRQLLADRVIR